MKGKKIDASEIDAQLKLKLKLAANDAHQARGLHRMLARMLTEATTDFGQWWLTDFGKTVLADMHMELGHSPYQGEALVDSVLDTLMLTPMRGNRRNLGGSLRELKIAACVRQAVLDSDTDISLNKAAQIVADSGEFDLKWRSIRNIYYKVVNSLTEPEKLFPAHFLKTMAEEE